MSIGSPIAKLASRAGGLALALGCAGAVAAAPAFGDGVIGGWQWLNPEVSPGASFTVSPEAAGSPSSFDASGSVAAHGSISAYHWKFGDGTSVDSSTPKTSHTYASAGSYTTTLTETDTTVISFFGLHFTRQDLSAPASHAVVVPAAPPPPPPPPPPPAPPPPPPLPVHLSTSPVTIGPLGNAWIWVTCPRTALRGCHGTVTIQLAGGWRSRAHRHARAVASRCARGCRALGTGNYQARAGQRVHVRVHIASFGRGLLTAQQRLRVRLTATSVAGARTANSSATITLQARRGAHR
jgi:PKD domain